MLTDYWAWHYFENPNDQEVIDDDFDLEAEIAKIDANPDDPDDWETVP